MAITDTTIVLLLIIVVIKFSKSDDLILSNQDIIHPTSGLLLQYKSLYRPGNKVVALSTIIPMVADMCYLIPIASLKKIHRCNMTTEPLNLVYRQSGQKNRPQSSELQGRRSPRKKRLLTDIISIGIGSAALTLSTVNTVQIANLKSEMKAVTDSLRTIQTIDAINKARMLRLSEGQMKLAMELDKTQEAVNRTMRLVNDHSDALRAHDEAIRRVGEFSKSINAKLDAFMHAVEGHFLRASIEDILRDQLNLHFIDDDDLPKVIVLVMQATRVSLDEGNSSITLLDLVTRLLVRQEISFVPALTLKVSPSGVIIGELLFTSYFAAVNNDEKPFFVYEATAIPFNHANHRVRLAEMPTYIGIRPDSRQYIRWSREEATPCSFEFMTSCRSTPAIHKNLEKTCIYQILIDESLAACRVEFYPEPVFVRRVGHYWAVSTISPTKCHSAGISDLDQYRVTDNHAITLPPTALIATADSTPLSCDLFLLPGLPIQLEPKLVMYQNATVNRINEEMIDLHSLLQNNTKWEKLMYISSELQNIINYMKSTPPPPEILFWGRFTTHSTLTLVVIFIGIIILLAIFQSIYCRSRCQKKPKITLSMPSWKGLEQKLQSSAPQQ